MLGAQWSIKRTAWGSLEEKKKPLLAGRDLSSDLDLFWIRKQDACAVKAFRRLLTKVIQSDEGLDTREMCSVEEHDRNDGPARL